jgi:hypothetical protein
LHFSEIEQWNEKRKAELQARLSRHFQFSLLVIYFNSATPPTTSGGKVNTAIGLLLLPACLPPPPPPPPPLLLLLLHNPQAVAFRPQEQPACRQGCGCDPNSSCRACPIAVTAIVSSAAAFKIKRSRLH